MINPKLFIWVSVLLSGLAQIFLKIGMTRIRVQAAKVEGHTITTVLAVLGQVFVWLWALCFAIAMVLWIMGLQHSDLSYAYPLVSSGYIVVTVLAVLFLKEKVRVTSWLAITVICAGVWLISLS